MEHAESFLDPTFLMTRDGDVELFKSPAEAADWLEAIDVEAGEYTDCYLLTGERLDLRVVDGEVRLLATGGTYDLVGLSMRLRELAERNGYTGDDPDPRQVANEVFANQWKQRWPRWPAWLDRRLHGEGPPMIDAS